MNHKLMLGFGVLCLSIGAAIGANMYLLSAEGLWAYRPLVLFLSLYVGALLTVLALKKCNAERFKRHGLSIGAGVLLGIGFPDILPLPFLLFVGFVPLLLLEDELEKQGLKRKRDFLKHVYQTAIIWNILATYWVTNTAFFAGVFAISVNSALMCLPFLLYQWSRPKMPKIRYAILIAYWICFEYLHMQWELTWPWLTLGNGLAEFPSLIQWYEFTGVFGGTLLIWMLNILFLRLWQQKQAGTSFRGPLIRIVALILIPASVSLVQYFNYEEKGESIDVAVIQPNYEPHYLKFTIPETTQLERFLSLSKSIVDEQTDYLVFPETSFGLVPEDNIYRYNIMERLNKELASFPQLKIVTGLNAYYDFKAGEPHSSAVRNRPNRADGGVIYYEVMNLAAQLPIDRSIPYQTYRKSKLVPGPENFPFKKVLFFMESIVDQMGGTTAGLGTQPERSVFTSGRVKIAPVICYESIFGEYFAGYVRKGANTAFIMTNDGWWDNTAGHRQHLLFASLRAIETRRSIARSANTGVSAFVNQRGDISQATNYDEPAAIRGKMNLNEKLTFYVKWGDLIARAALFVAIMFLLNTIVKRQMPEN